MTVTMTAAMAKAGKASGKYKAPNAQSSPPRACYTRRLDRTWDLANKGRIQSHEFCSKTDHIPQ